MMRVGFSSTQELAKHTAMLQSCFTFFLWDTSLFLCFLLSIRHFFAVPKSHGFIQNLLYIKRPISMSKSLPSYSNYHSYWAAFLTRFKKKKSEPHFIKCNLNVDCFSFRLQRMNSCNVLWNVKKKKKKPMVIMLLHSAWKYYFPKVSGRGGTHWPDSTGFFHSLPPAPIPTPPLDLAEL